MSLLSTFQPSNLSIRPTDVGRCETPHYCNEILRATAEERNLVALCWRLAADAARNYSRQCQTNYILSSHTPPDLEEKGRSIKKIQEANYRLAIALDPKSLQHFSSYWIFSTNELKEAAWSYRHWMHYSQARDSMLFEQEIAQAQEAVIKYRAVAPEASRFAQEAVHYFQQAQQIQQGALGALEPVFNVAAAHEGQGGGRAQQLSGYEILEDAIPTFTGRTYDPTKPIAAAVNRKESFLEKELISYRLKIAAYEAVHSAIMHLNLAAARSWNNKILIDHGSAAANLASRAFHFRIKAAEATQQGDELRALHWSLAASAASNACDSHSKLVELLPSGEQELIACWSQTLHAAEKAMERRHHAIALPQGKKRDASEQEAFWAEHCYECHLKKIASYLQKEKQAFLRWEKIIQQAQRITVAWSQAPKKPVFKPNFLTHLEYQHRKKIFKALWEELETPWQECSFCLTKESFPIEQQIKALKEGKLVPEIEFTCSHSWIYQTVQFLKQASIPCDLSMCQKTCGIMIAVTSSTYPSFGIDPPLSPDVFLVDVVADASPHPAAHCYIVQNRLHAEQLPNALFMPHWPQSRLIPRDRTRGTHFENIVFFGTLVNLAPELTSVKWMQRLRQELGLHFKVESPSKWNDYSTVDCAIGIRDFSRAPHFHKPATKLYNAWLAGVPFIGGSDSAYASDGHPGQDYLVATSLEELFEHLKELKENWTLRSRLVHHGTQSVKAFTKEATLERWKKLIQETLPSLALKHQKEIIKKQRRKLLLNYFSLRKRSRIK